MITRNPDPFTCLSESGSLFRDTRHWQYKELSMQASLQKSDTLVAVEPTFDLFLSYSIMHRQLI
jgi:hypothetical protein